VNDRIGQAIQEDVNRCQVNSVPWDQIHNRLFDKSISAVTIRRRSIMCKIVYCFAAAVAIFGLLIMSGFAYPVVAGALEQVPFVGPVYDFFAQCTGLQSGVINEFGARVNQTATDQGVSITITDVLYDQGRLAIGYMVTAERPDAYPPIPADWKTQYFNNGRVIHDTMQGTGQKIGNGWIGYDEIYPRGDLPSTFNLRIAIHQIGDRQGSWLLTIPVSRQRTDAVTKVVLPMQTVQIGQNTVTITKVTVDPSSTTIDYDVDESIAQMDLSVTDDSGDDLYPVEGSSMGHQFERDTKIWMLREVLESPKDMPKYLVLTPRLFNVLYPAARIKISLN
jgi:hypothetical protein